VTIETDVDVDLGEFDTDDLVEELERRGQNCATQNVDADAMVNLLESIWLKRRNGRSDYDAELDALIWTVLGRAA
jgi:hypothetical protein